MDGNWRVISAPDVGAVEIALERQLTLANELTSQSAAPSLFVWRCQRTLLVTRPETRLPKFEEASAALQTAGWPVVLRKSGGGACPVGPGTVQISMAEVALAGTTIAAKYGALAELIRTGLSSYQITAQAGPVNGAYCPGTFDLAVQGKKIAGMSQHWFRNCFGIHCVVSAASINVEESPDEFADVVSQFYSRAGSSLCCTASAITNMRLCSRAANIAGREMIATVINRFTEVVDTLRAVER
jgi:lipoate-protein ligase A